ncbi:hypothetical protein PHYPSEUDO_012131 [Phytophthora pseudosyringae]|uniref:Protein of centriole 5 n=1 Tax=Phytophthora pseudosyringae TaxID=221518 RepID=A0A8T1VAL1_9STRA|nr:hypothetical protein PHYPSEUDO_012131 [Phytophthora pseudosyringae]
MKSEVELSDKEWRQMRRQMPKLDFEPVPETPALRPRPLYDESDNELGSTCLDEKTQEVRDDAIQNRHDSPKKRSATTTSDSIFDEFKQTSAELPSTSMAVSPLITRRYQPREQKRPPGSSSQLDDAELAALDAQMAAAQDATRRSVMRAFIDLKAKKARMEALERMKLSTAHTSDIKILQNKVGELKEKVAEAEAQREQRDLLLERFSEFTVKQSILNEKRWSGGRSLVASFHVWSEMTRQKIAKRNAFCRILAQSCKRQQLSSFRYWKERAQGFLLQKQLQDQRDRYEHRIVEMAKEYQLKIQQV